MKTRLMVTGFVLGAAAALIASQAISQAPDQVELPAQQPPAQQPPADMLKMQMEEWMKASGPGDHHKLLERTIGTWETATSIWLAGPDAEPTTTEGVAERKWVLGGRFLMEELETKFPISKMTQGQMEDVAWSGLGMLGYDRFRNMYVGCWADTMGTQLLTMKGSANQGGDTFTFYGEMDEPMMGLIGRIVKFVLRIQDQDNMVFTIYDLHAGDDYRAAEVTYTRKK